MPGTTASTAVLADVLPVSWASWTAVDMPRCICCEAHTSHHTQRRVPIVIQLAALTGLTQLVLLHQLKQGPGLEYATVAQTHLLPNPMHPLAVDHVVGVAPYCAVQARNIAITVRTIVVGLMYLATFIFSANALGLTGV